ncbi:protein transporter tim9 [Puccinia graminis f. sp. tritici]|uniref:Mitochondrial import inner membrane translocase subunit n=1 Tax=Puccinia graminis f. sp. tritici TaxID=56615 RepID=A0A5B0MA48_PUCGR|nr:protein transporter tim9 [Puccinia graminis f. sp. tritici]
MDASSLSSQDSAQLNRLIEQKQMKDFLKLYSSLVERCFTSCCQDFTSRALSSKEASINFKSFFSFC